MKRTKLIGAIMISVAVTGMLFGCGKSDGVKIEQSKGVSSSEMTDAEVALAGEFGILQEEIDLNFSNLVLSTKNGDYDMLKWRTDNKLDGLDMLGEAQEYSGNVSYENTEYTASSQAYSLVDKSTLTTTDVYYNGDMNSRVFAGVSVVFNHFKDASPEISVMGITKDTDLDTIQKTFGNDAEVTTEESINLEIYKFMVSFNGLPAEVVVDWNTEKDCIAGLNIRAFSNNALPINNGLSAMEEFIKE